MFSLNLLLLCAIVSCAYGAHFRGGTWQWKPSENGKGAEVTYIVTFNGFRDDPGQEITPNHDVCTEERKTSQTELGSRGYITCEGCQPGTWAASSPYMKWHCTDLSIDGNWDIGGKTFYVQPRDGSNKVKLFYNQCCWVGPIQNVPPYYSLGWRMNTEVDLTPRRDNGLINSSPITAPLPVQQFHKGCSYGLEIPVTDPDNDAYRCRYTKESLDECYEGSNNGDMCGRLDYVTVYDNCTLVFDTSGPAGWYAVRVMIEDLDAYGDPLSKISLSFLLQVDPDDSTCETPIIVEPKRVCKTIPKNQEFEMKVIAKAATETLPINRIETQKPYGMTSSDLEDVVGNPLQKSVTLTWLPTEVGRHQLGFNAVDKSGYSSGWSFVSLDVVDAVVPVTILREESFPAEGQLVETLKSWSVQYSSSIKRPSESAYITILDEAGNVVDKLDASVEQQVDFRNKEIVFNVNLNTDAFEGERQFTLRVDDGVALDESYEGCTFNANGDEWMIKIKGSKPVIRPTSPPATAFPPITPPVYKCKSVKVPGNGKECFIHPPKDAYEVDENGNIEIALCCETICAGPPGDAARHAMYAGPPGGK